MATQKKSIHSVGNINSSDILTVPNCFAKENLENYSLVQLSYAGDKREFEYLDGSEDSYLLAAIEVMYDDESIQEFYVGKGEGGRILHTKKGLRFETTNFLPINASTPPTRGQFASWDVAAKKFQLVNTIPATPVGDIRFEVVDVVPNEYGFGQVMVRFEIK